MNKQLFKRCIVFTDLHTGAKSNSKEHNEDCLEFIQWMIETAKEQGAETCIFMGDFHHHRNTVNVLTLSYIMKILHLLNDNFEKTYMLVGNHDMFWREKRDVNSLMLGNEFPNITLIDNPTIIDDCAFVPWLVDDEWKSVEKMKSKYMFGHFELPGFKMNAMIDMPDHGGINKNAFKNQDYVFSGHFHKRQVQGRIHYIGNPFGHNYSDVWDFERGAMVLEWDGEPEFVDYADGPRYIAITLSGLFRNPDLYLKPKTHLQVTLDTDISYEEASYIREAFLVQYNIRELKLIKPDVNNDEIEYQGDVEFKSVDQIVLSQLSVIDSEHFDPVKLIAIYNNL